MDKEDIIEELAKNKVIETIASNIGGRDEDLEDLCQDLYISLLSKPPDLIKTLYETDQLRFYITKMVINNIRSTNSPFYTTYKKDKTRRLPITDIPDDTED